MNNSEHAIQAECYIWFHNTHPLHRGLLCYNLNNSVNRVQGAQNKALGLQAGRSDMVFYWNKTALMLECKEANGKQSAQQEAWERVITANGFRYLIFRNLDEFKAIIINELNKG